MILINLDRAKRNSNVILTLTSNVFWRYFRISVIAGQDIHSLFKNNVNRDIGFFKLIQIIF
jgi:hypothetical protein